jgi:hypothetical protein
MQDQLITFETAKLAKEKGFDWKVNQNFMETDDGNFHPDCGDGDSEMMVLNHNAYARMYSRPTQSLLQKWLREKHDVFIGIEEGTNPSNYYSVIRNKKTPYTSYRHYIPMWGDTYEEALEKGLQESLKIIQL